MSIFARQHSHNHGGSDMDEGMAAGSGPYNNYTLQRDLWVVIGSVVAFATLVNVLDHVLLYQRLRSLSARPRSLFWISWATATAIGREVFGASFQPFCVRGIRFPLPRLGPALSVAAYAVTIVIFFFIGTTPSDSWNWEEVAVRIGCINQAQLPLLFLLAGKQTVIGWLTGLTYERINWLHRWVARILWVGVTMHMGFFFRSWIRWDYVTVRLAEDKMTQTGFAGWWILTAIFFLSFAPVTKLSYEVFVVSHIVLFAGFIGVVMIHVKTGTEYVWACVAIFLFDRLVRLIVILYCNIGYLRGRKQFWTNRATFTTLPGGLTRITIKQPGFTWRPGQHVFLSCHSIVPFQSHPFTIASLPSDGRADFLVQTKTGATKTLHNWASHDRNEQKFVGVEGPYGHLRPLRQFHSVVLIAGSTGAAFTVPLMRDIAHRWTHSQPAVTKAIRFVWAIRSKAQLEWFAPQLTAVSNDVGRLRGSGVDVEADLSMYLTCADIGDCSGVVVATKPPTMKDSKAVTSTTEIQSVDSSSSDPSGCCCRRMVDDESVVAAQCCCGSQKDSVEEYDSDPKPQSVSSLKIFAGRPDCRSIIRKVLEDADGETAVVVCGPQELRDHVRRCVVTLSDERAVHKGTGAQGIYLHVEGFGY